MKLYLTRHEKTPYNEGFRGGKLVDGTPVVQSWSDGRDNEILASERDKAVLKGRVLSGEGIECIVHTGLKRTEETARLIAEGLGHKVDVVEDRMLRDSSYGFWDGQTLDELSTGPYAKLFESWKSSEQNGDWDFKLPHNFELFPNRATYEQAVPPESLNEVVQRISPQLNHYRESRKNTLIVGHNHTTKLSLVLLAENSESTVPRKDIPTIWIPHNAVYKATITPEFSIEHCYIGNPQWLKGVKKS